MRSAVSSDARAIADINVSSWRAAYPGVIPQQVLDELDASQLAVEWGSYIAGPHDPHERLFVIEAGGAIAGYARTSRGRDDDLDPQLVAEVCGFYIDPRQWGTGAGRGLMEAVLRDFTTHGFSAAVLWVAVDNRRARGFYEHFGFTPDGRSDKPWYGAPQLRYRMALNTPG